MKATKQRLAQIRNFNKLRISCVHGNLKAILQDSTIGLTIEERDSIRYMLTITTKLLSVWPKTVNPIQ